MKEQLKDLTQWIKKNGNKLLNLDGVYTFETGKNVYYLCETNKGKHLNIDVWDNGDLFLGSCHGLSNSNDAIDYIMSQEELTCR